MPNSKYNSLIKTGIKISSILQQSEVLLQDHGMMNDAGCTELKRKKRILTVYCLLNESTMRNYQVIVYGSYGYTGRLIIDECRKENLNVLLSGRNADKLKDQSAESGYPFEVVDIDEPEKLRQVLKKGDLVIHCGGPFRYTAQKMADACLETQTHYTDITGECDVFETLSTYHNKAVQAGIVIMPGTGFDVVPSDCLAVHLKNRLPSATHLQLAFAMSGGGLSRGTSKTMIEGLGHGSMIRQNGKLTAIGLGEKVMTIDFGPFKRTAMCIPWGDISTAWRSTRIPNIEVYSAVPDKTIRMAKLSRWINPVLRLRSVKNFLLNKVDQRPDGPDESKRQKGRSYLWGKVTDASGRTVEAKLETISGYLLTAKTSVRIAHHFLRGEQRPGYHTPAEYFGEDLILQIDGSKFS